MGGNLAAGVIQALDFHPIAVGCDHAVAGDIVDGRAPEHSLLAAGIFRDVAPDGGAVGTGRIHGENVVVKRGGFGHAARHGAAARVDHRDQAQ